MKIIKCNNLNIASFFDSFLTIEKLIQPVFKYCVEYIKLYNKNNTIPFKIRSLLQTFGITTRFQEIKIILDDSLIKTFLIIFLLY